MRTINGMTFRAPSCIYLCLCVNISLLYSIIVIPPITDTVILLQLVALTSI